MDILKKIIKIQIIVIVVLIAVGLFLGNKYIYLGMGSGSLISLLCFLLLCYDAKNDLASKQGGPKVGARRYLKRFFIYGVFLGIMGKYYDSTMLISGAFGLMTGKIIILSLVAWERIDKHLKKYKSSYIDK